AATSMMWRRRSARVSSAAAAALCAAETGDGAERVTADIVLDNGVITLLYRFSPRSTRVTPSHKEVVVTRIQDTPSYAQRPLVGGTAPEAISPQAWRTLALSAAGVFVVFLDATVV